MTNGSDMVNQRSRGVRELVHEVAPKLGEGYSEFIHKAVYERVKRLKEKDFEKAKKRVELVEKKKQLNTVRERERTLLREKGYKNKNVLYIFLRSIHIE